MQTYADILFHLPVDATLRTYLERHGLSLPAAFPWTDETGTTEQLLAAIVACPTVAVRDRIVAGLLVSAGLAHPRGKQAMLQVAAWHGAVLAGLIACVSDQHRAFWLFVHHPALFEQATEVDYVDHPVQPAQQHDVGVRLPVRRDAAALGAFRAAIQAFYQAELGCGEVCVAHILERSEGTQLVSIHAKDLATLRLEFDGALLTRRVGSPNIHLVLEYAPETGVVRTIVRGGARYHAMLVQAFVQHLLGATVTAQRIRPPTLDLSRLRLGFQVPQASADGFVALQVKSITLLSPDNGLKAAFTAMASSGHPCVTALLAAQFPHDNPLAAQWQVTAAAIHLYYPPAPGKTRSAVVSVEVTRRGRLNLHRFDEQLRAQLEGYLVHCGILAPQQTLSAAAQPRPDLVDERDA